MANIVQGIKIHNHPPIYLTIDYSASRPGGEKSAEVSYTFSYSMSMGSGGWYGSSNSIGLRFNVDGTSHTGYLVGNNSGPQSGSITFTTHNESSTGSSGMTIDVWCHQGTFDSPTGESHNCTAGSGSATYFGQTSPPYYGTIGNITVYYPAYNPYTPPQIWLNPNNYTIIGRLGQTSYKVNYSLTKGSQDIQWTRAQLFSDSKSFIWYQQYKRTATSSGYTDSYVLTSDNGFKNGTRYRLAMSTYDNTTEVWSPDNPASGGNGLYVYTYQEPTISTTLSIGKTSLNANATQSFTITGINNRAWTSYESEFQTRYRTKKGTGNFLDWISAGNVSTWNLTAADLRKLVPKANDGNNITIQFKRYSPSASWYSTNTASGTFVVYYRPRKGVTTSNTTYRKNNSSGNGISKGSVVINDSFLTGIYVSWIYDATTANAGYTQGYRIRLYNSAGDLVKSYYTTNKYYTIPKSDIPKIQNTYIDITPYYANDSTNPSSYWYYSETIDKSAFVILSSELAKPVITYPVQNSNWINNKFRVCFTLPSDADKGSEPESYRYEDIELQINGTFTIRMKTTVGQTTTGTTIECPTAFNALQTALTYQRPIVINPSLASGFPITSSYTLRVRVKKKYGYSSDEMLWSQWSDIRNITITTASFNPAKYDYIMASHYNDAKALINRVRNTYGVIWNSIPSDVIADNTNILRTQFPYTNFYNIIVSTKYQVNNYGTFDSGRDSVKFDKNNLLTENFTPVQEYITAASNETNSPNGRNYIKIVFDRCNKLI